MLREYVPDARFPAEVSPAHRRLLTILSFSLEALLCPSSGELISPGRFWAVFTLLPTLRAEAQTNVFVDFTDFGTRLNESAAKAQARDAMSGAMFADGNFTNAEVTAIQNNILAQLPAIYKGFTVNFVTTAPAAGNYERLTFGQATPTRLFGEADKLDYRNQSANDTARIFSANFSRFIDSNDRPTVLSHIATSLGGTAAHELGHDLGLQHYDNYGDPRITPASYKDTGGVQNTHIMATGGINADGTANLSGITTAQREQPRTFSQLETAKLEFGTGLRASVPASIMEQAAAHGTTATAQALTFTNLPLSGLNAANVIGGIGAADETDFYSFTGAFGAEFTANTFTTSLTIGGPTGRGSNLNTLLTLYAADGTTVLMTNDDITFNGNTIFNGGPYMQESLILNYILPATSTYYLRLTGVGGSAGNYELFVAVPEPGSVPLFIGMVVTFSGVCLRRRTRNV